VGSGLGGVGFEKGLCRGRQLLLAISKSRANVSKMYLDGPCSDPSPHGLLILTFAGIHKGMNRSQGLQKSH